MAYVPGGTFQMGTPTATNSPISTNAEASVTLDAFWIDKTEVTNAQYKKCVQAGVCKASEYACD